MANPDDIFATPEEESEVLGTPAPDGSTGPRIANPIPDTHKMGDAAREDVRSNEGFARDAFGSMGHTANLDKGVIRILNKLGIIDDQMAQDTLASMSADEQARSEQSPVASGLGRAAGEVGLGAVGGGAAGAGRLALSGAAQGAASEFGRTGDPLDTALGGATGAAIGAGTGAAARGLAGLGKAAPTAAPKGQLELLREAARPAPAPAGYSGITDAIKGQAGRALGATRDAAVGAGGAVGRGLQRPIQGGMTGTGGVAGALAARGAEAAGPSSARAQAPAGPQVEIGQVSRMRMPEAAPGEVSSWEIPPYEVELGEAKIRPSFEAVLGEAEIRQSPMDDITEGSREALIEAYQSPAMQAYPGIANELAEMLSGWSMGEQPDPSEISLMQYKLSEVPGLNWAQIDPNRRHES